MTQLDHGVRIFQSCVDSCLSPPRLELAFVARFFFSGQEESGSVLIAIDRRLVD